MILFFTHSRPARAEQIRFNTQPPEGGCVRVSRGQQIAVTVSTHSRPKAAARARSWARTNNAVSTHSRPKAAAQSVADIITTPIGFNTQPPEGGCHTGVQGVVWGLGFNTQPPEGGCLTTFVTDQ